MVTTLSGRSKFTHGIGFIWHEVVTEELAVPSGAFPALRSTKSLLPGGLGHDPHQSMQECMTWRPFSQTWDPTEWTGHTCMMRWPCMEASSAYPIPIFLHVASLHHTFKLGIPALFPSSAPNGPLSTNISPSNTIGHLLSSFPNTPDQQLSYQTLAQRLLDPSANCTTTHSVLLFDTDTPRDWTSTCRSIGLPLGCIL